MAEDFIEFTVGDLLAQLQGVAVVAAEELLRMAAVERVQSVLGYLDASDELGREPSPIEYRALELISNMQIPEQHELILVKVRWLSELAAMYTIATFTELAPNGREQLRERVRQAGRA